MDEMANITQLKQKSAEEPRPEGEEQQPKEPAQLTAADVERIVERLLAKRMARIQAEADGRVAQARSEGRAEAQRLSGMSEDERRRYEADAAKAREEELDRREEELNRRELRAWVAQELVDRGLPGELADVIDCGDAQRCANSLDALEKTFRACVQRSVDERLNRGHTLPRSGGDACESITQRMRRAAGLTEA